VTSQEHVKRNRIVVVVVVVVVVGIVVVGVVEIEEAMQFGMRENPGRFDNVDYDNDNDHDRS